MKKATRTPPARSMGATPNNVLTPAGHQALLLLEAGWEIWTGWSRGVRLVKCDNVSPTQSRVKYQPLARHQFNRLLQLEVLKELRSFTFGKNIVTV